MTFVNSILFSVLFTMFLVYHDSKQKMKINVLMPRSMHLHTEIYPNLKSISEFFKMYMKFILASRDNWVSCNQTLGTGSHQCWWDIAAAWWAIFLHHVLKYFTNFDKLFFEIIKHSIIRNNIFNILLLLFSTHNRFAETYSSLQLSFQITDRLLAAVNEQA